MMSGQRLPEGLLEYETLTGHEIDELLKGNPPHRPDIEDDEPSATSAGANHRKAQKAEG